MMSYNFGKYSGFLVSFLLFSTILFLILSYFDKLPARWSFFHVILVVLVITIIGFGVRKLIQ